MTTRTAPPIVSMALKLVLALLPVLVGLALSFAAANADPSCEVPPTGLSSALDDDGSGILLNWEASSCTPDEYAVHRRNMDEDGSKMRLFASVDGASLGVTDTAVEPGVTYRYRIRSNNQGPRSAFTEITAAASESDRENTEHPEETLPDGTTPEQTTPEQTTPRTQLKVANPFFDSGLATTISVDENTATLTDIGVPYTATDADMDTLTYHLSGPDDKSFAIDESSGQLQTASALDYETTSSYSLTIGVRDASTDTVDDATINVMITVTNVDEPGTVTITGELSGSSTLAASLDDIDGTLSNVTWRWARGSSASGTFAEISGATSASYTPKVADLSNYLQVTATYTDPQGPDKTAVAVTSGAIAASNSDPTFSAANIELDLDENSAGGENVGAAVTATDDDSDTLTYSLSDKVGNSGDAASFSVDSNGQVTTVSGADYNFEEQEEYFVILSVHDDKDAAGAADDTIDATIELRIRLANLDEPGTVTITGELSGSSTLAASLDDIDGTLSNVTWQWARGSSASGTFAEISGATSASYTPKVADLSNYLQVTATYTDPQGPGKTAVAVTSGAIEASNSDPTFDEVSPTTRSVAENSPAGTNVGTALTATDVDVDDSNLTYSLSGADAGSFELVSAGQIRTISGVTYNYESAKKTYAVTVSVHDGKDLASATDNTTDDIIEVTISLSDANDAPKITSGVTTKTISENSTAVAAYTATDEDPSDTLSWSPLENNNDDGHLFEFLISSSGELSFISAPDFETKQDVGENNTYNVTVKVTDGESSATRDVAVSVINVNEPPTIDDGPSDAATINKGENTLTTETIATYEASDVDAETNLTWTLEGDDAGDFTITKDPNSGHGLLRFRNVPNFEASVDNDMQNDYKVTVVVSDGSWRASRTLTVNVEDVNEHPTITTGATSKTIDENTTPVETYAADDVDANDTQQWSVESADDGHLFQINSDGELSFISAPDFEAARDNLYNVIVKVTDSGSLSAIKHVAVTVINVNEAPVFHDESSGTQQVDENTPVSQKIEPYIAIDQDAGTNFSWSLEGEDSTQFTIRENSDDRGVVRFLNSPNYEAPTDMDMNNFYKVTYKVRDNHSPQMEATLDVIIEVRDVNERPVISGSSTESFMEIEFDVDAADLTAEDYEVSTFSAYDDDDGDNISWSRGTGNDEGRFRIEQNAADEGVLFFVIEPDREEPLDIGSNNVYRVELRADDGQGESNSVGTFVVNVTVTDVDETPKITTTGPTYEQPSFDEIEYDADSADLGVVTYAAVDEEEEAITWSLSGDDAGDFMIDSSSGLLSFRNRPNYEDPQGTPANPGDEPDNSYEIVVLATDASPQPNTRELPVTVAVMNVNETPNVTGPNDNLNFLETPYDAPTSTPDVATFTARDEEGQDISWDLDGDDALVFTITKDPDSGAGVLTFKDPPDYENPVDADSLNTYEIIVQASDGTNTGQDEYAVTVTNVNERPEFTGTIDTVFVPDEHDANEIYTTTTLTSYSARDEEGGVTWSLSGTDSGDFNIGMESGVVTFADTPSFETPADSDSDNVYLFTIVATDIESGTSRLTATKDVTVTVMDVEEAGMITVDNLNPELGADCDRTNLSDPGDDCVVFTLTDPDGSVSFAGSEAWDLQLRLQGGATPWMSVVWGIPNETTFIYAPSEFHSHRELRALARYTDRRGSGKYAESEATAPLALDPLPNVPPVFRNVAHPSMPEGPAGRLLRFALIGEDRDNDTLTYGIVAGEQDAELFEVDPTSGQITVVAELDFESGIRTRTFVATLHDGKSVDADNNVVDDDTVDVTLLITVTVDDTEEEGVVTLSEDEPIIGLLVEATLTDGDGGTGSERWQWARSSNGSTNWVNISGATSASYTTVRSDAGFFLRAQVSYADKRIGIKSAEAITASRVFGENERPAFPSSEDGRRTVPENTPARMNFGTPVAASDPEDDRLTYTLRGPDAAAFSVVARSGQLRSSQPLDFETQPSYSFTIEVHDGLDGSGNPSTIVDNTQDVTVTVENVEEPGEVTLSSLTQTIQARVEVTATLEDDDGGITGTTWQWSRSPNGRTGWVNIAGATSAMYTPTLEEDAGFYIRATATYTDGHEPNKNNTASAVSPRIGDPPAVNSAPAFPATENGQREAPEDAEPGQTIGLPVVATDLNDDNLTYSLSGTDSALFTIDEATGQLRLAASAQLDFEEQQSHRVVVSVSDGADQNHDPDTMIDDTVNVVITVTDVNEAPVITGDTSPSFLENASTPVATFTGVDPEGDPFLWSINNRDFWISSRGELYFSTPPSFESVSTTHMVTVSATDDGGLSATLDVTVGVTDVEEEGVVTITPPRGWADVPTPFSAELTDDDGSEPGATWQWERSANGSSGWTDIPGARSISYTAGSDDVGNHLRAMAFYEDRRGSNKTATSAPTGQIEDVKPAANNPPVFAEETTTRTIGQGPRAGRPIGAPVKSMDADEGDILTQYLSGVDSGAFEIDPATGQLRTKSVLDPQIKLTYHVTVHVYDGFDASYNPVDLDDDDTVGVTITVTEMSENVSTGTGTGTGTGGGTGGGGGGGGGGGPPPVAVPSDADFDWNVTRDIESLDGDNELPTDLWSDGEIIWVLNNAASGADSIFAYDLATGERRPASEFALDARNRFSHGLWSDGETVWVADSGQDRLFAYDLASGERREEREVELAERNRDPRGIWSDGETMYVLDSVKDALFVYNLETGELVAEYPLDQLNRSPRGIWSDGVTLWVSDDGAKRLFAYRIEEGALFRDEDEEFTFRSLLKAGNGDARGIWSDGDVIYVADEQDDRLYSYNLPDAIDARLATLSLSGIEIGEFSPLRTTYEATAGAVTQTTASAQPLREGASVSIVPADADAAPGHQVALAGLGEIAVTVTSPDGSRTRVYRVRLEPGPTQVNQAPAASAIPPLSLTEGGDPGRLLLTEYFSDADGDQLEYRISGPLNTEVATATLADGVVTVTAAGLGATTFVLTANDGTLDSEPRTVAVTVAAAPTEAEEPEADATGDSTSEPGGEDATFEATSDVRITARSTLDGRVEFAIQQRADDASWGERLLPGVRYLPADAAVGRWLFSGAVSVTVGDDSLDLRIGARRLADGRVEFALQRRTQDGSWSGRLLPGARFLPAGSEVGRWLASSAVDADNALSLDVRIAARRVVDGRVEFAWQEQSADGGWAERLLPSARYLPADAELDRWLASSSVSIGEGAAEVEVRIAARRLADGRAEFALQVRNADGGWGELLLPSARYLSADAELDRWLVSSPLRADRPAAGS